MTNDGVTHDSPNNILKEDEKYFKLMFSFQSPPSPLTKANCMDFFPRDRRPASGTPADNIR